MSRFTATFVAFALGSLPGAFAQSSAKVDFGREVYPVLRQNCFGCHGPAQQMKGLRLDRRSSVFKLRRVVPGSSENSFLYHRISGSEYGPQMPPTGPLTGEQIATIKGWIEQGAEWPDALANEQEQISLNPKAAAMVDMLRAGDRQAFLKSASADPQLLNARGPEGSTPFMYAVLYGDAASLERLIEIGADVNARNDAKATPLMWAATDLQKTRVLLAGGADPNAISDDGRTPLIIAAGTPAGSPIVRLLLDKGAKYVAGSGNANSPLIQSALAADSDSMALLLERGPNLTREGGPALMMALTQGCARCVDLLLGRNLDKGAYTFALLTTAKFLDAKTARLLLDRGADVNAVDRFGRTALMYAAGSDLLPLDFVKLLVEHGADVSARSTHAASVDSGLTALDIARLRGENPVSEFLAKVGGESGGGAERVTGLAPKPAVSAQVAIQRSLPLLQRAAAGFSAKSGCLSCHNSSLTAMTLGSARKAGFPVNEQAAAREVEISLTYLEKQRDLLHQGSFAAQAGAELIADTIGPIVLGYVLVGLHAEGHGPDANTDAVATYIKSHQSADGQWIFTPVDGRPPLFTGYIGNTALAMRALQLYAPKTHKAAYDKSVQLAAAWIEHAEPRLFEDRVWRTLALAWAGRKEAARAALRGLLREQRPDGGWSDLPNLESNAYATGRALVAAQAAGLAVSDPAYRKGVQYLLSTQMEDGSWYVRSRALAVQPYFDAGFPYGVDQWISAAGTNWATMALILAAPPPVPVQTAAR